MTPQEPFVILAGMKLSKARIEALASRVSAHLSGANLIGTLQKIERVTATISAVITKELKGEDRLDREVNQVMKKYEREMQDESIDSRAMVVMIKKQGVKERDYSFKKLDSDTQ